MWRTAKFVLMWKVKPTLQRRIVWYIFRRTNELEVLEDARVFDYGGETYTLELLEDYKSLQTHQPEKLKDPEFGFCIYDNIDDSAFGDSAAFAHRHPAA